LAGVNPPRRFAVLQHAASEGPGLIAAVAPVHGVSLDVRRTDRGEGLPPARDLDGVVVLGGPMAVYQSDSHPYLADERALLADACAMGLPVLGVCLGAQLVATALGARVYPGPAPEIGVGEIRLTPEGERDPVLGPAGPRFDVYHWHGDTFDLPTGATHLAASGAYAHQAFRAGPRTYALQFHVELDAGLAREWADARPREFTVAEKKRAAVERTGRAILHRFFAEVLR
jgi:GMP synthase-like glutamine amidotransferase